MHYYEITVAKNGSHFFATHERSIRDTTSLNEIYEARVEARKRR